MMIEIDIEHDYEYVKIAIEIAIAIAAGAFDSIYVNKILEKWKVEGYPSLSSKK